jgi:hypothetical protein
MILRRITEHVKAQNWFAVALDFVIVVFGVFMGIQLGNWNDVRADRATERVILERLEAEFRFPETELQYLAERLSLYQAAAKGVTVALKEGAPPENQAQFLEWLADAPNLGRPPARSATYVQLLSSGDLDLLSNGNLRDLLVRYDQNIERNSFMYDQTLALLLETGDFYAATNSNFYESDHTRDNRSKITDYDFEALKSSEGNVEWLYYMHSNNLNATNDQLALTKKIMVELRGGQ